MAINTIAGFNVSFPELIDSRIGPFSSVDDAIAFTNQNFRVIGQKVIVVDNAEYRNLNSSSPTITGGDYREFVYTGTVDDVNLTPITPKIVEVDENINGISIYSATLTTYRGGYVRFNTSSETARTRTVTFESSANINPGEIIEFVTELNDGILINAGNNVTINDINRSFSFKTCTVRCISSNFYEVIG
mgnify:CR=1 FL=1